MGGLYYPSFDQQEGLKPFGTYLLVKDLICLSLLRN
jgi:hypothetical protein